MQTIIKDRNHTIKINFLSKYRTIFKWVRRIYYLDHHNSHRSTLQTMVVLAQTQSNNPIKG